MPLLPGHALGRFVGADHQDLWIYARRSGVDVQLTEESAERLVLIKCRVPVAEEDQAYPSASVRVSFASRPKPMSRKRSIPVAKA